MRFLHSLPSVIIIGLVACSSKEEPTPTECEAASAVLCEKACSCGKDGECNIRYGDATLTMGDSLDDCKSMYALACANEETKSTLTAKSCRDALDTATCTDDGVELPSACDAEK